MEIHSAGPGGVDPQSSLAESPPKVSLQASKLLVVQCQNNLADDDSEDDVCRICWAPGDESPLYYPCACRGSIKYVHEDCILQWLNLTSGGQCQVCKHAFVLSMVYDKNTPSMLSFRELLHGVVLKIDLARDLDNVALLIVKLFYLSIVWATETQFMVIVTTPVMPAWRELLFSVVAIFNTYGKLGLLKSITPHLRILGWARPVAFVFARWIFPSFGYSINTNSAFNRFSWLGCLGLEVGWCVVRGLLDLYNGIRDDRYLVRGGLQNYMEREKAD